MSMWFRRRHWIPPGALAAGFAAHGLAWCLLLALAVRSSSALSFPALAWLHLVTLGWLTMLALAVLIHVVPAFCDTPWKAEGVARGSLLLYGAGVAALVIAFWCGAVPVLPWAGSLVLAGLLAYFVPALWTLIETLKRGAVEAAIARALLLTFASLIVTVVLGVLLALVLAGHLPAAFLRPGPPVHATFGIIGWLTVLVTGITTRTFGPITGARARFAWIHIAVGAAQLAGLIVTVVGLLVDVAPVVLCGAALIALSAILYVGNVADILRRTTVRHRPPQAFIGAAAIWLVAGIGLAVASLAGASAGAAAVYVLLVGWVGQMTNAHLYHIGVRLIATIARGDEDDTRPGELLRTPLSWASFAFFQGAVATGAVALAFDLSQLLAIAAACGLTGWVVMAANMRSALKAAEQPVS